MIDLLYFIFFWRCFIQYWLCVQQSLLVRHRKKEKEILSRKQLNIPFYSSLNSFYFLFLPHKHKSGPSSIYAMIAYLAFFLITIYNNKFQSLSLLTLRIIIILWCVYNNSVVFSNNIALLLLLLYIIYYYYVSNYFFFIIIIYYYIIYYYCNSRRRREREEDIYLFIINYYWLIALILLGMLPCPTDEPRYFLRSSNATSKNRRSFKGLSESTLRVLVRFRLSHFCFIFVCLQSWYFRRYLFLGNAYEKRRSSW